MIFAVPAILPSRLPLGFPGRGRDNFSHRVAESSDTNRPASLANLPEDAEDLGLELGDGDFFHTATVDYGQWPWSNSLE